MTIKELKAAVAPVLDLYPGATIIDGKLVEKATGEPMVRIRIDGGTITVSGSGEVRLSTDS